jgi:hypothetical protein
MAAVIGGIGILQLAEIAPVGAAGQLADIYAEAQEGEFGGVVPTELPFGFGAENVS